MVTATKAKEDVLLSSDGIILRILRESVIDKRFWDIRVDFLGKKFCLHRIVLWGIPYFRPLLEGEWADAQKPVLTVSTDDPLVTCEAFEEVILTVYGRPLALKNENVKSVLAAASFLQMEHLCKHCAEHFAQRLSLDNAIETFTFATSYCYNGCEHLSTSCKAFMLLHAMDLKSRLHELPTRDLCEIVKSDQMWVKSEYERFQLAVFLFHEKLNNCIKHGNTNNEGDPRVDDQSVPFREAGTRSRVTDAGDLPNTSVVDNSEETIRTSFDNLLSTGIHYGSLTEEEAQSAFIALDELRVPQAMRALANGMIQSLILQRCARHAKVTKVVPNQLVDTKSGWGWFRVGVQIDCKKSVPMSYISERYFFGGCGWRVVLGYSQMGIGVFLQCERGNADDLYVDVVLPHVGLKVICKEKTATQNCLYSIDKPLFGFPDFLAKDVLHRYLDVNSCLRITVLLQRLFR